MHRQGKLYYFYSMIVINMGKKIIASAAIFLILAVALGAFGAHALRTKIPDDLLAVYHTGVEYHFYHALGLLLTGVIALLRPSSMIRWSAILLGTGIVLFSGSLYIMAVTGMRWLGAVTPVGGLSFIGGWALLLLAFLKYKKQA